MNLGYTIKELRKEKRLTQDQLASLLNLKRSTIAGYETNRKQPDNATLIAIADFFNVSLDYLLGRVENKSIQPNYYPDYRYITVDDDLAPLVSDFVNRKELHGLVSTLLKLAPSKYNRVINILNILSTETRPQK